MSSVDRIGINCKAILDELKAGKFTETDLEFLKALFTGILEATNKLLEE